VLLPFKKGPFVLAIAAGAPIVPVYCAHTFGVLPKGSIWVRPRPIALYFGDPISTEGLDYEDRERLRDEAYAVVRAFREQSGDGHVA
jgi:1-acyl-sn-glycerol-3-phosphate acyltransferase